MSRASGPRRAAASAGIAVALAAGAASGLVAADLERALEVERASVSVASPVAPDATTDAPAAPSLTPAPVAPSLTPAPTAPQNPRAGQAPHTTTRAS
jgi:hypothetical protein